MSAVSKCEEAVSHPSSSDSKMTTTLLDTQVRSHPFQQTCGYKEITEDYAVSSVILHRISKIRGQKTWPGPVAINSAVQAFLAYKERHSADGGSATIREGVSHPSAAGEQVVEGPEASQGEPILLAEPPLPLLACGQAPFRYQSWLRLHGTFCKLRCMACSKTNAAGPLASRKEDFLTKY